MKTLGSVVIVTPILLITCEITPKVVGARLNLMISNLTAKPLYMLYRVARPIRAVLRASLSRFAKLLGASPDFLHAEETKVTLKEEDILLLAEQGVKEGMIDQSEVEMLRKIFLLDDTPVSNISTPLAQILTLPCHLKIHETVKLLANRAVSRVPLYRGQKGSIVGILYTKDLMRYRLDPGLGDASIEKLMREPHFIDAETHLNRVFRLMKRNKAHIAVVQDKSGQCTGVVTLDDVLFEIFEDAFPVEMRK
jgi:putative hemolysin